MYSKSGGTAKNAWVLVLFILCGIVVGGFIGYYLSGFKYLAWLDYGTEFGLKKPFELQLGILDFTFGFNVKINIASVIGLVASLFLYRRY